MTAATNPRRAQVVSPGRYGWPNEAASRLLTEHYAGGRVIALSAGTQPGDTFTPRWPRPREPRPRHVTRAPERVTRDGRGQRHRHHPGLRRRCPWCPRVPRLAPGRPRGSRRRHRAAHHHRPRHTVRALLVELVPDLDLPPSVLDQE